MSRLKGKGASFPGWLQGGGGICKGRNAILRGLIRVLMLVKGKWGCWVFVSMIDIVSCPCVYFYSLILFSFGLFSEDVTPVAGGEW